jgi:predicted MFS family arabinose efflux permease
LFGAGVVLAPALGPSIGGVLVEWFGWRSIFFVASPFCLLALPLAWRLLPHSAPGGAAINAEHARLDVVGLTLATAAVLLGLSGLSRLTGKDWPVAVALLVASGIALAVFIVAQRRIPQPLIRLELFEQGTYTRGAVVAFIYGAALFGSTYLLPVFMQMALDLPPSQAGAVLLPAGIALALVIPIVGRLSTPANRGQYIVAGLALLAVSFFAMVLVGAGSGLTAIVALALLGRIGLGCILPSLNLAAMEGIGTALVAQGTSVINLLRQLGGASGVGLIGVFLEWRLARHADAPVRAFHEAFVLIGLLIVLAIVAAWGMRRRAGHDRQQ